MNNTEITTRDHENKNCTSRKSKLNSEEQLQICQWIAEFKTPSEIQELLLKSCGKTLNHSTIIKTYTQGEKWKDTIKDLRKKFINAYTDLPIANKRIRLQWAEQVYHRAMKEESQSKLMAALGALEFARKEVEGNDVAEHRNYCIQKIDIEGKSTDDLIRELNAKLSSQYR